MSRKLAVQIKAERKIASLQQALQNLETNYSNERADLRIQLEIWSEVMVSITSSVKAAPLKRKVKPSKKFIAKRGFGLNNEGEVSNEIAPDACPPE
jgi:hypothetical protein